MSVGFKVKVKVRVRVKVGVKVKVKGRRGDTNIYAGSILPIGVCVAP